VLRIAACASGAVVATLPTVVSDVIDLRASPDGSRLVVVGADGRTNVFEADPRSATTFLLGHQSFVYAAAFADAGPLLVTAAWDGSLRRWNALTGEALGRVDGLGSGNVDAIYALSLAPDRPLAAVGTLGHSAKVVDYESGRIIAQLVQPEENAVALAFDRTGRRLIVASNTVGSGASSAVVVWDTEAWARVHTFERAGSDHHARIIAARRADWFALALGTQLARFRVDSGQALATTELAEPSVGLALSADDAWLASGGRRGSVRVCDAETLATRWILRGHGGPVYGLAFAPDGTRLATGSDDGTIRVWDLENGREIVRWTAHDSYVHDLAFAPDGESLVSASGDGTLRVWDTRTERERRAQRELRRAERDRVRDHVERSLTVNDDISDALAELVHGGTLERDRRKAALETLWLTLDAR
jgi:WD40 repeat protein